MAVPGRRNGLMDDDDNDVEDGLFEEGGIARGESDDTPPHLRPLLAAVQSGDVQALRLALDGLNGSVDEPLEDGDTALHLSCLYGHLPCVQLLLERGASVLVEDEDGAIPLHDASAGGFTEIVQLLLNRATNRELLRGMLEKVDAEGDMPLHHAARGEHVDTVRILLSHGALPTRKNSCDKTPGELAGDGTETRHLLDAAVSALPIQWQ